MRLGAFVHYHNPLYNHHHQRGVVVYETERSWGVSVPKFRGGSLNVLKTDPCLKATPTLGVAEKLSVLASFGPWWYGKHKSLYQSILVVAAKERGRL